MTQRQIAEVFGVSVPTINEHLAGIYVEEELDPARTVRQVRIVQTEGKRSVSRLVEQFALPTIMTIGFRVHIEMIQLLSGARRSYPVTPIGVSS